MSNKVETSIIISVSSLWSLTRACLLSLNNSLKGKSFEIILLDNASTDETRELCRQMGELVFHEKFKYYRFENRQNFSSSYNYGARIAHGKYLIFLDNYAEALPGWYDELLNDFKKFPDIACTGPILLYPHRSPLGETIHHLGNCISPDMEVKHLYEGIPANSDLAKKRRFFQLLSSSCMMIKKSIFMEVGLFDERFFDRLEYADLCSRLATKGYRITVNPEAKMLYHNPIDTCEHNHCSCRYYKKDSLMLLVPDVHRFLADDALILNVGPWLNFQPDMPKKLKEKLSSELKGKEKDELVELIFKYPVWSEGYKALRFKLREQKEKTESLDLTISKIWASPSNLENLFFVARENKNTLLEKSTLENISHFWASPKSYLAYATKMLAWAERNDQETLAIQFRECLNKADEFIETKFRPFLNKSWGLSRFFQISPENKHHYALWLEAIDKPTRLKNPGKNLYAEGEKIEFSLLMPLRDSRADFFRKAVESVVNQLYPSWELCIAASNDCNPELRDLALEYEKRYTGIKFVQEKESQDNSLYNIALRATDKNYIGFLESDGILSPDALKLMARVISENPKALLLYSDEDKILDSLLNLAPIFKNSNWDKEELLAHNNIGNFLVLTRNKLTQTGPFTGAPDTELYEFLLNYTLTENSKNFIHIPKITYSKQITNESQANYSLDEDYLSKRQALVQKYLDKHELGAIAEIKKDAPLIKVIYPQPEKSVKVSIIIDFEEDILDFEDFYKGLISTVNKDQLEIIALHSSLADQDSILQAYTFSKTEDRIQMFSYPANRPRGHRTNMAISKANGDIIGILSNKIESATQNWLSEIVAQLSREEIGAVAGKIILPGNKLLHGGYLYDGSWSLVPILQNLDNYYTPRSIWSHCTRNVDALDCLCFFTTMELIKKLNGFDPTMPFTALHDFCLRMKTKKMETLWLADVKFYLKDEPERNWLNNGEVTEDAFSCRWEHKNKPFNKNLLATPNGWKLNSKIS